MQATERRNAIYARYSSHAQDDGTSIDLQIEACEKAAGGACKQYIDRARTGRTTAARTALAAMLADAERGLIGRVWVYKFNRIGRDLADAAGVIRQLEDADIEVASATEGSDPFARSVFLAMAEHYSRELAQNTRAGLMQRAAQGFWTGGPAPYGYKVVEPKNERKLAIDPDEAAIVREVFDAYTRGGQGMKNIARDLTDRAVPTRRAKRWAFTSVRLILTSRIVTGVVEFNRRRFKLDRRTGNRVPVRNDSDAVRERHDESLRIITDEQFDAAQRQLAGSNRTQGGGGRRRVYPFTGLIRCSKCGVAYYAQRSKNAKGEYVYYQCGDRARYGVSVCDSPRLREDRLMDVVNARLAEVLDDADAIIAKAIEQAKAMTDRGRSELQRLTREREAIAEQMRTRTALLTDPIVSANAEAVRGIVDVIAELKAKAGPTRTGHRQDSGDGPRHQRRDCP
jgi:site-specific DNA recombinase